MADVGRHPKIKLMTLSEVEGVSGYIGNFKVKVRRKARYVNEVECTACGDCAAILRNRVTTGANTGWTIRCGNFATSAARR